MLTRKRRPQVFFFYSPHPKTHLKKTPEQLLQPQCLPHTLIGSYHFQLRITGIFGSRNMGGTTEWPEQLTGHLAVASQVSPRQLDPPQRSLDLEYRIVRRPGSSGSKVLLQVPGPQGVDEASLPRPEPQTE